SQLGDPRLGRLEQQAHRVSSRLRLEVPVRVERNTAPSRLPGRDTLLPARPPVVHRRLRNPITLYRSQPLTPQPAHAAAQLCRRTSRPGYGRTIVLPLVPTRLSRRRELRCLLTT